MKYDIFISYKSESVNVVMALAHLLESNGIRCWYAPRNLDNSGAGKDYDDEIVGAIRDSHAVVVVLTDDALRSKWVKREISQAEKQDKFVIPYVISELSTDNGLRMRLENKHWIDAYPNPEQKFSLLLKNVKLILDDGNITVDKTETRNPELKPAQQQDDFDFEEGIALLEMEENKDAFCAFLRSTENGNIKAQEYLFRLMHQNNKDITFIDEDTWEHIEELSDEGIGYADLLMHYKYYGMGIQADIAMKYLKRAMDKQVSPYAFLQMGICYNWGYGVNTNHILGVHYYQKALKHGCNEAYAYLGQAYRLGWDKIEKDIKKAEEYLLKGIEVGDDRSYKQLFSLYSDKEPEKALQIAQRMIDDGIKGGYCEMGDYYYYVVPEKERDINTAIKWYREALNHKEAGACGMLASINWNNGDHQAAYHMAKRGKRENDSSSLFMLGYFYEYDENYAEAWKNYQLQMDKFGIGAENLGDLYLNYHYLPDNVSIDELKKKLEVSVRNLSVEAIKCLLKIMVYELNKKKNGLDYKILKNIPKAHEYIKLGAEQGDDELKILYAKLMSEEEAYYNPYQSLEVMEKTAQSGNVEAVDYLLTCYQDRKDEEKLKEWSIFAVYNNVYVKTRDYLNNIDHVELVLKYAQVRKLDDMTDYISSFLNHDREEGCWSSFALANYAFNLQKKGHMTINDEYITYFRKVIIDNYIDGLGYLRRLKDHYDILFPEYNPEIITKGDFSNEQNFKLFYAAHTNLQGDEYVTDFNLSDIYKPMNDDISLSKVIALKNGKIVNAGDLDKAITSFIYAYNNICNEIRSVCKQQIDDFDFSMIVPYASPVRIQTYNMQIMKCLLSVVHLFKDKKQMIIINLCEWNKLLDIAEGIEDEGLQLLLIEFVECQMEMSDFFVSISRVQVACLDGKKQVIADELNRYIDELNKNGIEHQLPHYTIENLPDVMIDIDEDSDDDE